MEHIDHIELFLMGVCVVVIAAVILITIAVKDGNS